MLFKSAIKSCDFIAELVDLLRLTQILNERFFMFVVLELLGQPFDFVLAYCILRVDCRMKYSRYSVIHGVAIGSSP